MEKGTSTSTRRTTSRGGVTRTKVTAKKITATHTVSLKRGHRTISLSEITPSALYYTSGLDLVRIIRSGVPATTLVSIVHKMDIPKERLYESLRLPRSTMDRKIKNKSKLSVEHSERVIGLERLIGQVEAMVAESGNPEGFNASQWVGEWLEHPLQALGGAKPGDFMDTMEGQELISKLLAQSQSGAYA